MSELKEQAKQKQQITDYFYFINQKIKLVLTKCADVYVNIHVNS